LKTELVHHHQYQTRSEAARAIAEYIDLFDNRQRRQARLPVACGLHATVHAAATGGMNIT
jgi:hypothetical protein